MAMDFVTLAERAHKIAKNHGWHEAMEGPNGTALRLLLIHSEVSEAVAELRTYTAPALYLSNAFVEELADVLIRLGDLVVFPEIGLERFVKAVEEKMETNAHRPHLHGGKLF